MSMLALVTLPLPHKLTEEWLELFDWVGRDNDAFYPLSDLKDSRLSESLAEAYARNPARNGLLTWLAVMGLAGCEFKVPRQLIEPTDSESPFVQRQKICLRLFEGGLGNEEISTLVQRVSKLVVNSDESFKWWPICQSLERFRREDWTGTFVTELAAQLPSACKNRLLKFCINHLNHWLELRRSPLHDPQSASRLRLRHILDLAAN